MEPLVATQPLTGFFWSWIVPVLLFVIAFGATWLLYKRFSKD